MEARERLQVIDAGLGEQGPAFAEDVARGLQDRPRKLSCKYFYDREGSELFERICALEEYYLTRAERQILEDHAAVIVASLPERAAIVELGSGSSAKTRLLLEAALDRGGRLSYVPVDVSRSMLVETARALIAEYERLDVTAIAAEYEAGLAELNQLRLEPKLVLWLGSNIGNFDRPSAARFLARLRDTLGPEDRLLVGVDLRKDPEVLVRAYDDASGVTAEFNKNILRRINRELGADFDLAAFAHRAVYDERAGRIEMYLVSLVEQRVRIPALGRDVVFGAGEPIHTEDSHKYSREELDELAESSGLVVQRVWLDREARFAEVLLGAAPATAPALGEAARASAPASRGTT